MATSSSTCPHQRRHRRNALSSRLKLLQRVVGPIATNLYVLGDEASGEAIAIDTATPCVEWLTTTLAERGWTLKLIVSTHRHWDHIGDNAAAMDATGAEHRRAHARSPRHREPAPSTAPFPIPPSVPALDLAEGSRIRFGAIDLEVLHTPGHTEGSVCLLAAGERLLFTGDTLFAGSWGRTDLPGGTRIRWSSRSPDWAAWRTICASCPATATRARSQVEKRWLDQVARAGCCPSRASASSCDGERRGGSVHLGLIPVAREVDGHARPSSQPITVRSGHALERVLPDERRARQRRAAASSRRWSRRGCRTRPGSCASTCASTLMSASPAAV